MVTCAPSKKGKGKKMHGETGDVGTTEGALQRTTPRILSHERQRNGLAAFTASFNRARTLLHTLGTHFTPPGHPLRTHLRRL